jgi:GNAT superfamily N-acetyltransferase
MILPSFVRLIPNYNFIFFSLQPADHRMDLNLIACTDKEQWDRFAMDSPHGSVFCFTPFLDGLGEDYRLLMVEEGGEPLCGVVLHLRDGQPCSGDCLFGIYQGVLLSSSICDQPLRRRASRTSQILNFLLAELETSYDRISVCQHYRFDDLRSFSRFHYDHPERGRFRIELQYSGVMDLSQVVDFDRYLRSIRNLRRREYQRCRTGGFCVCPSRDLDTLFRLYQQTYARQGLSCKAEEVRAFLSGSQAALEKGFGEMLICVAPDGAVVSASVFLRDRDCAYYWIGANDPEYRQTGSGTYLMIETIRRWQQKGLKAIDFVGINSPNRGDFKTSFNALPVRYFTATWERPPSA